MLLNIVPSEVIIPRWRARRAGWLLVWRCAWHMSAQSFALNVELTCLVVLSVIGEKDLVVEKLGHMIILSVAWGHARRRARRRAWWCAWWRAWRRAWRRACRMLAR